MNQTKIPLILILALVVVSGCNSLPSQRVEFADEEYIFPKTFLLAKVYELWKEDKDCLKENRYLEYSTLNDYSCEDIEIMIKSNWFFPVVSRYNSSDCEGNEAGWQYSYGTAGCKECAKDEWMNKYFNECKPK